MKLLLFDVDGTLIKSSHAGRAVVYAAFEKAFDVQLPQEQISMAGRTDLSVLAELAGMCGISNAALRERLGFLYNLMVQFAPGIYHRFCLEPVEGIMPLLTVAKEHPEVVLGLLTGNIEMTTGLKLNAAGIPAHYFQVGAFGSDSIERNKLPEIAWLRAKERTGHAFSGATTTIIGDTPADIACARYSGSKAVALATGTHSAGELDEFGPDALLQDLANTEEAFRTIMEPAQIR